MSGPEHFRAGEDALSRASHLDPQADKDASRLHAAVMAEAQTHFAAAQTAVWGLMAADADMGDTSREWAELLGVKADGE